MYSRKLYTDLQALLRDARRLIETGRVLWSKAHQAAHDVTEFEAYRAVAFAGRVRPDRDVPGRYVVWSRDTRGSRLIRVVFEIQHDEGNAASDDHLVIVTAFEE